MMFAYLKLLLRIKAQRSNAIAQALINLQTALESGDYPAAVQYTLIIQELK